MLLIIENLGNSLNKHQLLEKILRHIYQKDITTNMIIYEDDSTRKIYMTSILA